MIVGNLSHKVVCSFITAEVTLGKDLMSVVSVGSVLDKALPFPVTT